MTDIDYAPRARLSSPVPVPAAQVFLDVLLPGWSLTDEVVEEVALLTSEITEQAHQQGHGLVSMSVSFADRRLRVAVVDGPPERQVPAPADGETLVVDRQTHPGAGSVGRVRWFELTPQRVPARG